jgi:hypothetical protein
LHDWSICTGEHVFWNTKQAKAPTDLTSFEAAHTVVICSIAGAFADADLIRSYELSPQPVMHLLTEASWL